MGIIADMIRAGVDPELIERMALEMSDARVDEAHRAIEARRKADRDRQARHRNNVTSRDIALDNATERDTPPSPYKDNRAGAGVFPVGISNDIPPIDSPLPSEGPQAEKRKSGTCLPEDWSPPEELFAYGAEQGLSREQTGSILEDMRIWAVANRNRAVARKADWNLTAKGFIRRDAAKFKARAGPRSEPKFKNGWAAVHEEIINGKFGENGDNDCPFGPPAGDADLVRPQAFDAREVSGGTLLDLVATRADDGGSEMAGVEAPRIVRQTASRRPP